MFMKMSKIIVYIVLYVLVSSCSDKEISMNSPSRSVTDIESEVRSGNIKSYHELRTIYLDFAPQDFLFWAMLMANRYN